MSDAEKTAVYHPRKPQQSPLWKLLDKHYPERFAKSYGYFRLVVRDVVQDYLKCGDLREGFARVRCPDCRHEYLLAFSCRGRWFCPSCHSKKGLQFGEHLKESILCPVPHRQYVFSIPIILRRHFKYDRKLLGKLCRCASNSLLTFFRTALGVRGGVLGAVMAIQTFGDYGKWHPHLHLLVADGLFFETGSFYVMPRLDLKPLQELFRAAVLKMLQKEGKIRDDLIAKILRWRHTSGFSVHNGEQLARDDAEGREALAQYIIRNQFSLEKVRYKEEVGTVIYRSKMTHGKNRSNFKIFGAEDFIATITQHIPEKSFQLVRYYGWYSNRARGERRLRPLKDVAEAGEDFLPDVEILDVSDHKARRIPSKTWRECIKKVWEVDPLVCPHCQAEMKTVSFISEKTVIRRILDHLGLWTKIKPVSRPPPLPAEVCESWYEPLDDGWGHYEEPCIRLH
jgi:hypothetical protein